MASVQENVADVQEKINRAAERAGRDPADITIVAVAKGVDVERIRQALEAGIPIIGENKVQEALQKVKALGSGAPWHMVGHLQRNKVKEAVRIFSLIQSLDSLRLAEEINSRALTAGTIMDVLVQVNTSQEESKYGLEPQETLDFVKTVSSFKGLSVRGLMTIGAFLPEPEQVRPCFRLLREVQEQIIDARIPNIEMDYLSMGMTSDFEVAVEEGANMLRIGTAIFGPRE
ncbi:MAG: YggS family pyridoxal phosphate-dependent enzyme [Gemmatimonadota bacterium]|nr:MAG: YggS family pyridoxal phosphate-dependent enzyme [Gemmatimonadota bacterium]